MTIENVTTEAPVLFRIGTAETGTHFAIFSSFVLM